MKIEGVANPLCRVFESEKGTTLLTRNTNFTGL